MALGFLLNWFAPDIAKGIWREGKALHKHGLDQYASNVTTNANTMLSNLQATDRAEIQQMLKDGKYKDAYTRVGSIFNIKPSEAEAMLTATPANSQGTVGAPAAADEAQPAKFSNRSKAMIINGKEYIVPENFTAELREEYETARKLANSELSSDKRVTTTAEEAIAKNTRTITDANGRSFNAVSVDDLPKTVRNEVRGMMRENSHALGLGNSDAIGKTAATAQPQPQPQPQAQATTPQGNAPQGQATQQQTTTQPNQASPAAGAAAATAPNATGAKAYSGPQHGVFEGALSVKGKFFQNFATDAQAFGKGVQSANGQGFSVSGVKNVVNNTEIRQGAVNLAVRASVGLGLANVVKHVGFAGLDIITGNWGKVGDELGQAKDHAVGVAKSGAMMWGVGKGAQAMSWLGKGVTRVIPALGKGVFSRIPVIGGAITWYFGQKEVAALEEAVKNGQASQEQLDNTRTAVRIQSLGNLLPVPFLGDLARDAYNLTRSDDAKPGYGFTGSLVQGGLALVGIGQEKPMEATSNPHYYRPGMAEAMANNGAPAPVSNTVHVSAPPVTPSMTLQPVRVGRF